MKTASCYSSTIYSFKIVLFRKNYFIQAGLRTRGLFRLAVQATLGEKLPENKIQIDLSSLDPFSGSRVDVGNEYLPKE